jgi:hypothetical protein
MPRIESKRFFLRMGWAIGPWIGLILLGLLNQEIPRNNGARTAISLVAVLLICVWVWYWGQELVRLVGRVWSRSSAGRRTNDTFRHLSGVASESLQTGRRVAGRRGRQVAESVERSVQEQRRQQLQRRERQVLRRDDRRRRRNLRRKASPHVSGATRVAAVGYLLYISGLAMFGIGFGLGAGDGLAYAGFVVGFIGGVLHALSPDP